MSCVICGGVGGVGDDEVTATTAEATSKTVLMSLMKDCVHQHPIADTATNQQNTNKTKKRKNKQQ
jgi:acetamidase/formamidase